MGFVIYDNTKKEIACGEPKLIKMFECTIFWCWFEKNSGGTYGKNGFCERLYHAYE